MEDTAHVLGPAVAENLLVKFPLDHTTEKGENSPDILDPVCGMWEAWEIQMLLGMPILYPDVCMFLSITALTANGRELLS